MCNKSRCSIRYWPEILRVFFAGIAGGIPGVVLVDVIFENPVDLVEFVGFLIGFLICSLVGVSGLALTIIGSFNCYDLYSMSVIADTLYAVIAISGMGVLGFFLLFYIARLRRSDTFVLILVACFILLTIHGFKSEITLRGERSVAESKQNDAYGHSQKVENNTREGFN